MSSLGRRVSAATQRNNNFLNNFIQIGINQKIWPENFRAVMGRNTSVAAWQKAYSDGKDDGFVFAKRGDIDTIFNFGRDEFMRMQSNPNLWRTSQYQRFEKLVRLKVYMKVAELAWSYNKILLYILKNKIGLTDEAQKAIAEVAGVDLNVNRQVQNQSQCKCVKTEVNGLNGGQVAEPNKVNWGNIAKTAALGLAAGYGLNEAINYFTDKKQAKKSKGLFGLSAGQRKGYNKLKSITARARKIQDKNPRKKWTACISQAARELK